MFATKEQVEKLKQRTEKWKAIDYRDCDPLMKPIINIFNDYEGLATVFCCEGHVDIISTETPYIMFAITEDKGFVNLSHFYNELVRIFSEPSDNPQEYVSATRIRMTFTTRLWPGKDSDFGKPYPVVNLGVIFRKEEAKQHFYRKLYDYFSLPFVEKEEPSEIK